MREAPLLAPKRPAEDHDGAYVSMQERKRLRRWAWEVLSLRSSKFGRLTKHRPSATIELVVVAVCLGYALLAALSTEDFADGKGFRSLYLLMELLAAVLFGVEYLVRLWACVEAPGRHAYARSHLWARLRWMIKPLSILDLVTWVFFVVGFCVDASHSSLTEDQFDVFRVLRMITSLLRLERHTKAFKHLRNVLAHNLSELVVVTFVSLVLLLTTAAIMCLAERGSQPNDFGTVTESLWWAAQAITTTG